MRRTWLLPIPVAIMAAGLTAGTVFADGDPVFTGPAVKTITATLRDGTGADLGLVQVSQDSAGTVRLTVDASKLPAGSHGIHIHAVGKCEPEKFTTAGGHFNPGAKKHGLLSADGSHAGDLPQVDTASVSSGYYNSTSSRVSLTTGTTNIFDVDGSALVIHASADDQVTDPTGNSGDRIACAVLAVANPALATPPPATATTVAPLPPKTGNGLADMGGSSRAPILAGLAAGMLAIIAGLGLRKVRN